MDTENEKPELPKAEEPSQIYDISKNKEKLTD